MPKPRSISSRRKAKMERSRLRGPCAATFSWFPRKTIPRSGNSSRLYALAMKSRSFCSRGCDMAHSKTRRIVNLVLLFGCFGLIAAPASRGDAPTWMHNLVAAPVPAHDEKTDAAVMYSEKIVTVQSADKIKILVRKAYKILRPDGRDHGLVFVSFNSHSKVTSLHGWC